MGVSADLTFEVDVPGRSRVTGSLRGEGSHLALEVSDAGPFLGTGSTEAARGLAATIASKGMTVRVVGGGRHLVTLGAVSAPWWQRLATRSPHVRLGSPLGVLTTLRARSSSGAEALPDLATARSMAPPPTLFPLFPTMRRPGPPPPISTTHDPARGGSPSLVVQSTPSWIGVSRGPLLLSGEVTVIGSDPACDIVLPGLRPQHAEIHHDEDDEFMLLSSAPDVRVNGQYGGRLLLRTGSRVQLGEMILAFTRAEFADHGRPYGGRLGGELGRQRPQPPRRPGGAGGSGEPG